MANPKERSGFTCARPGCGQKFLAVYVKGDPVCPDCKARDEEARLRQAKRDSRARARAAKQGICARVS
jgi:hypothetical protein